MYSCLLVLAILVNLMISLQSNIKEIWTLILGTETDN